jgi:hypothetical protein
MRRASLLLAILAGAALARPTAAEAQPGGPDFRRYQTPQRWALELRFSPYSPEIDEEFGALVPPGGTPPHECFFGKGRRPLMQAELDYQLFRGFGSAGIGLAAGFFRERAKAFKQGTSACNVVRSGDRTQLSLVPLALLGVYRLDEAWRRWRVPIVPYAKAGLNYTLWWIYDGNGDVARVGEDRAKGGSLGWQAAVGVSLVLDFIDLGAARSLDEETGINGTHAFFELVQTSAPAFGRDGLRVGDRTWAAGLMFEF